MVILSLSQPSSPNYWNRDLASWLTWKSETKDPFSFRCLETLLWMPTNDYQPPWSNNSSHSQTSLVQHVHGSCLFLKSHMKRLRASWIYFGGLEKGKLQVLLPLSSDLISLPETLVNLFLPPIPHKIRILTSLSGIIEIQHIPFSLERIPWSQFPLLPLDPMSSFFYSPSSLSSPSLTSPLSSKISLYWDPIPSTFNSPLGSLFQRHKTNSRNSYEQVTSRKGN